MFYSKYVLETKVRPQYYLRYNIGYSIDCDNAIHTVYLILN